MTTNNPDNKSPDSPEEGRHPDFPDDGHETAEDPIGWGIEAHQLPEPQRHLMKSITAIKKTHPAAAEYLKALYDHENAHSKKAGFKAVIDLMERMETAVRYNYPFSLEKTEIEVLRKIVNDERREQISRRAILKVGAFSALGGGLLVDAGRKLDAEYNKRSFYERLMNGEAATLYDTGRQNPKILVEGLAGAVSVALAFGIGVKGAQNMRIDEFSIEAMDAREKRLAELPEVLAPAIEQVLKVYREKMGVSDVVSRK